MTRSQAKRRVASHHGRHGGLPGCDAHAAAGWNLLGHSYRPARWELLLTDTAGVEVFARAGLAQARPANLYGLAHDFLDASGAQGPRDIDVLSVGNLQPAVQRERLPWLGRLARLAGRRRVEVRTGVFGAGYRALLARARVVFSRSGRCACNGAGAARRAGPGPWPRRGPAQPRPAPAPAGPGHRGGRRCGRLPGGADTRAVIRLMLLVPLMILIRVDDSHRDRASE
jgi:hypothetical protein